jgi:hypothetical protein
MNRAWKKLSKQRLKTLQEIHHKRSTMSKRPKDVMASNVGFFMQKVSCIGPYDVQLNEILALVVF